MTEAGAVLIVVGSVFCLLASVGMLRFPDVFTRIHAASKAGVLGAGLIFIGVALTSLDVATSIRMGIGLAFLLVTTPLAAHLLGRATMRSGRSPKTEADISDDKSDAA